MVKDHAGANETNAGDDAMNDLRHIRLPIMHHRQNGKC